MEIGDHPENQKTLKMKEVYLYEKKEARKVRCTNCAHYCVIDNGKRGICGVRENQKGVLYALNYGKIIALSVDPIEKKPLFHFLPGSRSVSIATVGCNFRCSNCQNWSISQSFKAETDIPGDELKPEDIVQEALRQGLPSISYTYTEPTIFSEFALDTMKLAREMGLKNVWVSNGFMSKESAEMIIPYLDANNIDIKSLSDDFYREHCGGRLAPVLETAKLMKDSGVWVEITTLVIPGLTDSEENLRAVARFVKEELGEETPWHVTQFSGALSWKLKDLPDTPVKTLERAYHIGKEAGLKYVYTGNIPGLNSENTVCPECGAEVIQRTGYLIKRKDKEGKCPECGADLNITTK